MAMFTALTAFASKEYKFQQRKSISLAKEEYGAAVANGVCFGAVMMWVREKLTTNGSPWNLSQARQFSPSFNTDIHARNGGTMLQAAGFQQLYSRSGAGRLAEHMGLREARHTVQPVARPGAGFQPEIQLLATLTRAGEDLPESHAIVIELGVHDAQNESRIGGHAIGMYRSRGNHLHFFDPNVGVYQVRDIGGFMQAWLDGCRYGRGWTFSPFRQGNNWLYCYER